MHGSGPQPGRRVPFKYTYNKTCRLSQLHVQDHKLAVQVAHVQSQKLRDHRLLLLFSQRSQPSNHIDYTKYNNLKTRRADTFSRNAEKAISR
jgi:hypothetical protein